jgi:hypothetical protein
MKLRFIFEPTLFVLLLSSGASLVALAAPEDTPRRGSYGVTAPASAISAINWPKWRGTDLRALACVKTFVPEKRYAEQKQLFDVLQYSVGTHAGTWW